MLRAIRNNRFVKYLMTFIAFMMMIDLLSIKMLLANGPSQPEMLGPSAQTTDNMVDPFTGDFSYSVPLFEMGDVPITLNYSAGISMDQESSWVGLGWSLNPGSITRSVRGLPDDFKDDEVINTTNIRPNQTVGVGVSLTSEVLGLDKISPVVGLNLTYNNYTGFDFQTSISMNIAGAGPASLGLTLNSQSSEDFGEIGLSPSFSWGEKVEETGTEADGCENWQKVSKKSLSLGLSSTRGVQGLSYKKTLTKNNFEKMEDLKGEYNQFRSSQDLGTKGFDQNTSHMFNDLSFTPKQGHAFNNVQFTFRLGFGADITVADPGVYVNGFYSGQFLKDKVEATPALGYLYYDNSAEGRLFDFNRENDGPLEENAPILATANLTYDLFSVSGPGIGGTFRAYRNDVGYVEEKEVKGTTASGSFGGEFSIGNMTSPGIDIVASYGGSNSESWTATNEVAEEAKYTSYNTPGSVNEHVYFGMMGESSAEVDQGFVNAIGGKEPIEFTLLGIGPSSSLQKGYSPITTTAPYFSDNGKIRDSRKPRSTNITYMTVDEVERYFPLDTRHHISDVRKGHHIGRIVVTADDGTRYVYGLPVYNKEQHEVLFNVGKIDKDDFVDFDAESNQVGYSETQNSPGNTSGNDHYYNEIYTPAFASAFLLTEVLSPDFVDITGNGPSDDDLGNYVKYTYGTDTDEDGIYEPNIANYKWRTPLSAEDNAGYWEGMRSDASDDKANYTYGVKEIWYLDNIETKQYKAVCTLSTKEDGCEVLGKDGGVGTTEVLMKLDEIQLFSKPEIHRNEIYNIDPEDDYPNYSLIPLKTVHFEYDYSLCDNFPLNTSGGGKLTLKKVYFTYNESYKGQYSSYVFGYDYPSGYALDNTFENPSYDFTEQDRWGIYKPDPVGITNNDYPYTNQNDENLDYYASAWCLKEITTPTNSKITIDYASDDYAYVQDRQATQMTRVLGIRPSNSRPTDLDHSYDDEHLYNGEVGGFDDDATYKWLIFDIPDDVDEELALLSASDRDSYVKEHYLLGENMLKEDPRGIPKNLYFKFLMNTNKESDWATEGNDNEYVTGYCELDISSDDYAGAFMDGSDVKGFVKLKMEVVKFSGINRDWNPISKTGFQYCMQNVKYNILDAAPPDGEPGSAGFVEGMADVFFISTLIDFFKGPNGVMRTGKFARTFVAENSWVRLQNPQGAKKGGGHRVTKISINDHWSEMTDEAESSFDYAIVYNYTTDDGNKSSGVAAYEPAIGGDENALKQPLWYNFDQDHIHRYKLYKETPFCESMFPSPVVGYSRVVIKNIDRAGVTRTATGYVEKEFYTAKEFPTKVSWTTLDAHLFKPDPVISLFKSCSITHYGGSQGFAIETNDMHGKPKSERVYGEKNINAIAETIYTYNTDEQGYLDNNVNVIDPDGHVSTKEVGVTYDLAMDFRTSTNWSVGASAKAGADIFVVGFVGIFPNLWASADICYNTSNLAVTTKVVSRNALLASVEVIQDGSRVITYNHIYDSKSGQALLTSAQNEYNDDYYSFSYPAHWTYQGAGMASDNSRFMFVSETSGDVIDWSTGRITDASIKSVLSPGDEIGIVGRAITVSGAAVNSYSNVYCWVYEVTSGAATPGYYLVTREGATPDFSAIASDFSGDITGILTATVYRSGKRNLHSSPVASFVSKAYPIDGTSNLSVSATSKIINASATEYSDVWQKTCAPGEGTSTSFCECGDLTDEAVNFFNMLENLFHESFSYDAVHGTSEFDNIDLYSYSSPSGTESFYHEITPLLVDVFPGFESTYKLSISTEIVGESNNILDVDIFTSPTPDSCSFRFEFQDVNEEPFDLTDPDLYEDVFGNPDELTLSFSVSETECEDATTFTITFSYIDDLTGLPTEITAYCYNYETDCLTFRDCTQYTLDEPYCSGSVGSTANPYVIGVKGIWYPKLSYTYLDNRDKSAYASVSDIDLREDGEYNTFSPFWQYSAGVWTKNTTGWTWTVKSMLRDPSIGQIEAKNALEIPSSTLFGNNNTIFNMVSDNAHYKYIGYENFEDNEYINILDKSCGLEHFDFNLDPGIITEKQAHTGNYSLEILEGYEVTYQTSLSEINLAERDEYPKPFTIINEDCLPPFSPEVSTSATYTLTLWAKQVQPPAAAPLFDFDEVLVSVKKDGTSILATDYLKSDIIEGWQRLEYTFTVPSATSGDLTISIKNNNTAEAGKDLRIFIDDIKVAPEKSIAKCYVYDYRTQWLMSELDENHFATFYEYDEEGKLVRVKKETEKGIMTIQEGRYNLPKDED